MDKRQINQALTKTLNNIKSNLPILLSVVLLIGLVKSVISVDLLFSGNLVLDTLIGAGAGSVLAGNPVTSYILGGEFIQSGVPLAPVTAFLLTWVTVGIVQLPAESLLLGREFAIARNISAFLSAVVIAFIVWMVLG